MPMNVDTPLYDALCRFARLAPARFHVPGHKGRCSFTNVSEKTRAAFEQLLALDATELPGLDDLHDAQGVIAQAQSLAADTFFAGQTCFLVGGSTLGNLAMILGNVYKGEVVLVQRNCHQSIFHALQMAEARVVLVDPVLHPRLQVPVGLTPDRLQRALAKTPQAKALILTYPNYYGMAVPLAALVEQCQSRGLLVLVDEAHGAHFGQASFLPPSAMQVGADVSVQSTHKMLTSLTMTSMLHIRKKEGLHTQHPAHNEANTEEMLAWLRRLQSSSPSYPLLASLDLARAEVQSFREKDWQQVVDVYAEWILSLGEDCGHFVHACSAEAENLRFQRAEESIVWQQDPLKWIISAPGGMSGFELQRELAEQRIYVEMADQRQVVLTLGLLPRPDWLQRLKLALNSIVRAQDRSGVNKNDQPCLCAADDLPQGDEHTPIQMRIFRPEETEEVGIGEAKGRVAAEMVTPYPPGVPLCIPGEVIGENQALFMDELWQKGTYMPGKTGGKKLNIRVLQ